MRWLLLLALALTACSATEGTPGDGGGATSDGGTACRKNQLRSCMCPNGIKGAQVCTDGMYGECMGCPSGDGGGGTTTSACSGCAGCCASGTCVPTASQSEAQCGRRTESCRACGAGETCIDGACVAQTGSCSIDTCQEGCCQGNTCVPFAKQSARVCGSLADACAACPNMGSCQDGQCMSNAIGDAEVYHINVRKITLAAKNGDSCWDDFFGACNDPPDPYLEVTTPSGTSGHSTGCSDMQSCVTTLDEVYDGGVPLDVKGADLKAGLTLIVLDNDGTVSYFDDAAGMTTFKASMLQPSYTVPAFGQVTELVIEIYPVN